MLTFSTNYIHGYIGGGESKIHRNMLKYVIYVWPQQSNRTGNIFCLKSGNIHFYALSYFFLDVIKAAYMQLSASFGSISLHMLQYLINKVTHYYFQAKYILKFCFHNLVIAFSRLHLFKILFCKTDFVTIIFAMLIRQFRVVVCIFIWKDFQLLLGNNVTIVFESFTFKSSYIKSILTQGIWPLVSLVLINIKFLILNQTHHLELIE